MRKLRTAVLTGIAALAVAGVGLAAARDTHTLKVDLPDGSVAPIEYRGDIAPKVTLAPVSYAMPVAFADGLDSTPFAALDHVAAELDRETAAMIHRAAQLQTPPMLAQHKLEMVALGKLPAAIVHYQIVSTAGGSGSCTRSVEMTSYGWDQKPGIISTSSGDCTPLSRTPAPIRVDTPVYRSIPSLAKPRMADNGDRAPAGTIV